jgi:DNA mismatch repair protein MLH1
VLLPAVKAGVVPPRQWATDGTLLQLASLERLYRIFERC